MLRISLGNSIFIHLLISGSLYEAHSKILLERIRGNQRIQGWVLQPTLEYLIAEGLRQFGDRKSVADFIQENILKNGIQIAVPENYVYAGLLKSRVLPRPVEIAELHDSLKHHIHILVAHNPRNYGPISQLRVMEVAQFLSHYRRLGLEISLNWSSSTDRSLIYPHSCISRDSDIPLFLKTLTAYSISNPLPGGDRHLPQISHSRKSLPPQVSDDALLNAQPQEHPDPVPSERQSGDVEEVHPSPETATGESKKTKRSTPLFKPLSAADPVTKLDDAGFLFLILALLPLMGSAQNPLLTQTDNLALAQVSLSGWVLTLQNEPFSDRPSSFPFLRWGAIQWLDRVTLHYPPSPFESRPPRSEQSNQPLGPERLILSVTPNSTPLQAKVALPEQPHSWRQMDSQFTANPSPVPPRFLAALPAPAEPSAPIGNPMKRSIPLWDHRPISVAPADSDRDIGVDQPKSGNHSTGRSARGQPQPIDDSFRPPITSQPKSPSLPPTVRPVPAPSPHSDPEEPVSTPTSPDEPIPLPAIDAQRGNQVIVIQRGITIINHFGGVGRGRTPTAEVLQAADTLRFASPDFTAQGMGLSQQGHDLVITFETELSTQIILKNFALDQFDNLAVTTHASVTVANSWFIGQPPIEDSLDVFDADQQSETVFQPNTVTFLNDLDNRTTGFEDAEDVINGQGGNDQLDGLSGNDTLRGNSGEDTLIGGRGDDRLLGGTGDDWIDGGSGINDVYGGEGGDRFILSTEGGLMRVHDFQVGSDQIVLPSGQSLDQVSIRWEGINTMISVNQHLQMILFQVHLSDTTSIVNL